MSNQGVALGSRHVTPTYHVPVHVTYTLLWPEMPGDWVTGIPFPFGKEAPGVDRLG